MMNDIIKEIFCECQDCNRIFISTSLKKCKKINTLIICPYCYSGNVLYEFPQEDKPLISFKNGLYIKVNKFN